LAQVAFLIHRALTTLEAIRAVGVAGNAFLGTIRVSASLGFFKAKPALAILISLGARLANLTEHLISRSATEKRRQLPAWKRQKELIAQKILGAIEVGGTNR
jgi:hypothetical protein